MEPSLVDQFVSFSCWHKIRKRYSTRCQCGVVMTGISWLRLLAWAKAFQAKIFEQPIDGIWILDLLTLIRYMYVVLKVLSKRVVTSSVFSTVLDHCCQQNRSPILAIYTDNARKQGDTDKSCGSKAGNEDIETGLRRQNIDRVWPYWLGMKLITWNITSDVYVDDPHRRMDCKSVAVSG